jgi:hypothetical protein
MSVRNKKGKIKAWEDKSYTKVKKDKPNLKLDKQREDARDIEMEQKASREK